MSNIALANLPIAVVPKQQDVNASASSVTKKDSQGLVNQQDVSKKGVTTDSNESMDGNNSLSNLTHKFSFTELLQKRLTNDTSGDTLGSSKSHKQAYTNKGLTEEKQKTDGSEKENKHTISPLLSGLWFACKSLEISPKPVTHVKSSANQPIKAVQTAQTNAPESIKPILNKGVTKDNTADKTPTEDTKEFAQVNQKSANDLPKIKTVSDIDQAEKPVKVDKPVKNAVSSALTDNYEHKPSALKNPVQPVLAVEIPTKSTEDHIESKLTKKSETSIKGLKSLAKVALTEQADSAEVVQVAVNGTRSNGIFKPMVSSRYETETLPTASVTAAGTEKAVVQQAFMRPSEQVIDQIQNKITGSAQEIRINLSPAELGSVRITFRQQEGQIEGLLEVENPQVRKDIEKAMPQIAAILAQNGIQVRRIDIAPMQNQQQNNQQSFQSPEHHFSPSEHQFLTDQGHRGPSRGSETGVQQEIQGQTDMSKNQNQTVYDLSGMNMYA